MVTAVSGAAARRPWWTIAAWLGLVVALVVVGQVSGTRTLSDVESGTGQSLEADDRLAAAGLAAAPTEAVLVRSPSAATTSRVVTQLEQRLDALAEVAAVSGPAQAPQLLTDGGRTALVDVTLRGDPADAGTAAAPVQAVVAEVAATAPGASLQQSGDGSVSNAVDTVLGVDLHRAELISLPLTLVVLLIAFGSLVAAAVPLLLGLTCVAGALGVLGPVSALIPTSESASTLVVLIGLAVGVDYSLFLTRRERAERRAGAEREAALTAAVAGTSRAIVMAGVTVMAALAGLLLTGMALFVSLAVATILVVAMAVLASVTVLPAVLAVLGDRVEAGRLRPPRRLSRRRPVTSRRGPWDRIGSTVSRHPVASLVTSVALLVAIAAPALGLSTAGTAGDNLPSSVPAVAAAQSITAAFPSSSEDAALVVEGAELSTPAARVALAELGALGTSTAGGSGPSSVRVAADGRTAVVTVSVPAPGHPGADEVVTRLRELTGPDLSTQPGLGPLAGSPVLLTGAAARDADFADRLASRTPLAVGAVLLVAFLLVRFTFGSARLALAVVGLDLLSVGAAYGILAAVFQHEWAAGALDFTPTGAVVNWVPLFAFVILFGLSMDYTVIVLERIRESRARGLAPRTATAEAVGSTGGTVTAAAVVMVAVFAIFVTLRLVEFKQLGVGLAASIAIDATLIRGVALPAAVCLLGTRGWRVPLGGVGRAGGPRTGTAVASRDDAAAVRR